MNHPLDNLKKIGDAMTRVSMKEKWNWRQRAKMACILNKWQTPKMLGMRRPLTKDEIATMLKHMSKTVSTKAFLMYWNLPSNRNNFGMEIE